MASWFAKLFRDPNRDIKEYLNLRIDAYREALETGGPDSAIKDCESVLFELEMILRKIEN